MTVPASDPLYPLVSAPGVADAAERARSALAAAHRHRFNLRGWSRSAAIAGSRAARASDLLAASDPEVPSAPAVVTVPGVADPIDAPAFTDPPVSADPSASADRPASADRSVSIDTDNSPATPAIAIATALGVDTIDTTVATWRRAPLQVLARLHVLAAGAEADPVSVGRPRSVQVARRLDLLAQLVTGATVTPAPIVAAVVHGELLSLSPFGSHDGVVARGAARLTTIASGLDPHGLGVPEIEWMRRPGDYRSALAGYADGAPEAVIDWVILCCRAMELGAGEAVKIADSLSSG